MAETLYVLVRYDGSRTLTEDGWRDLMNVMRQGRFVNSLAEVGEMAGNYPLKEGDLKLNEIGAMREWLFGVIVNTTKQITANQFSRLSRWVVEDGVTLDPEVTDTVLEAIQIVVRKKADDYGIARQPEDGFLDLAEAVLEYELRLAVATLLPPGEELDFRVKAFYVTGRGALQNQNISAAWNTYVAGSAIWD